MSRISLVEIELWVNAIAFAPTVNRSILSVDKIVEKHGWKVFLGHVLNIMADLENLSDRSIKNILKELSGMGISSKDVLSYVRKLQEMVPVSKQKFIRRIRGILEERLGYNALSKWRKYASDRKRDRSARKIQKAYLERYYSPDYKGQGGFKKGQAHWNELVSTSSSSS